MPYGPRDLDKLARVYERGLIILEAEQGVASEAQRRQLVKGIIRNARGGERDEDKLVKAALTLIKNTQADGKSIYDEVGL